MKRIEKFILDNVEKHPKNIVKTTMEALSISRTTVIRHLNRLVESGVMIKSGTTKQTTYTLANSLNKQFELSLNQPFDEFQYFHQLLGDDLEKNLNENAYHICEYGVTEMLNNCKDHSSGSHVQLRYAIDAKKVHIEVEDNGIGVFKNIGRTYEFEDKRDIPLELSKGKLTTDKANHTGEGIFFSARSFDFFSIDANQLTFFCNNIEHDWSLCETNFNKGSRFIMEIERQTPRNIVDVFKKYQNPESLAFTGTDIVIKLAQFPGERLISRSQAKRVLRNLEKFTHATLDFTDIQAVGQGFVDQVFRIGQRDLNIEIDYINANPDVDFMIKRGLTAN